MHIIAYQSFLGKYSPTRSFRYLENLQKHQFASARSFNFLSNWNTPTRKMLLINFFFFFFFREYILALPLWCGNDPSYSVTESTFSKLKVTRATVNALEPAACSKKFKIAFYWVIAFFFFFSLFVNFFVCMHHYCSLTFVY